MAKELCFEVKMTAKDLWQFSLYHANNGMLGIFNIIFTGASLFLVVTKWGALEPKHRVLLVFCALLFTVIQPALLYQKARKQAKLPAVQQPMRLLFSEQGLNVEQGEQKAGFTWEQIGRVDRKKTMVIVYMDRIHAYLLPNECMAGREDEFFEMVRMYLPKERRRKI